MAPDRGGRQPERAPDLTTPDDRPVWVGEITDGDLPVVVDGEMWHVPVDNVDPSTLACGGPLPVLDTMDMERVSLFEDEPHAEAVVTPTVVVELMPREGQWCLQGFVSADATFPSTSEETLWERDGLNAPNERAADAPGEEGA